MKTNFIREFRKRAGLTQEELAEKADVHLNTLNRWEVGTRTPLASHLQKLAEVLHTTTDELLNDPAKNELTIQFVWEVENMNPIAMTPNVFSVGYQGDQYLLWGSLPQNMTPDEIAERIKRELIAAAAGLKARNKSLAKQSGE